jgi:hypothetical protein
MKALGAVKFRGSFSSARHLTISFLWSQFTLAKFPGQGRILFGRRSLI